MATKGKQMAATKIKIMQFQLPPMLTSMKPQSVVSENPPVLVDNINTHDILPTNEAEMKCQTADIHDSSPESLNLTETNSGASSDFKFFPDLTYKNILPVIPWTPLSAVYKSSKPKVRGPNRRGPELTSFTCSICNMVCPRRHELERYQYFSYLL
jgi:hypothetical protein